jgi:hypothetical protein
VPTHEENILSLGVIVVYIAEAGPLLPQKKPRFNESLNLQSDFFQETTLLAYATVTIPRW